MLGKLVALNPGTEIWWDSSPLVYPKWKMRMIEGGIPKSKLDHLETLFAGATTNPLLSLQALRSDPKFWTSWISKLDGDRPSLVWKTYLEVIRRGSGELLPLWKDSGFRFGYLSGQVDPRDAFDGTLMLEQALEISRQNPNVMVKCPGTAEGLEVLKELTALGIPTNCTLCFTVSQMREAMQAVKVGSAEASRKGIDMSDWRSVVSYMSARYEERQEFEESASGVGVKLTVEDRRWSSVAIFRKAYRLSKELDYPGKLLLCSMRIGPLEHIWHLELLAGGNMVFTFPPTFLAEILHLGDSLEITPTIEEEVPVEVLDRLLRIPYFVEAYADKIDSNRYASLASMQYTLEDFSRGFRDLEVFVGGQS